MCSPKTTSQQNQTQTISPNAAPYATSALGRAQQVSETPYQAYNGELVAPVNSQQSAGIGNINAASGIQNPYNSAAGSLGLAGAGNIAPTQFSGSQVGQYESPYQKDVINSTLAQINNQNQQQQQQLVSSAIGSGAFGGDRAGVAQAALAGQQDIATNSTLASLNNQNYQQALSEFNNQQQTGLGAAQNNAARQLAAGQFLGGLGSTAQQEALTGAGAQIGAGTLQQQTSQAQDTAGYNQYLQQLSYPFQTASWLSSIIGGIGGQLGGTATGVSETKSSPLNSIFGGLTALASLFNRGGRVPHMAGGGGLGGAIMMPYGGGAGPGSESYVPQVQLQNAPAFTANMDQKGGQASPAAPSGQQLGQSLKTLGSAAKMMGENFGLGSDQPIMLPGGQASSPMAGVGGPMGQIFGGNGQGGEAAGLDPASFMGGLYAAGGAVRPRYADGGDISQEDLAFDPSAMGYPATMFMPTPDTMPGMAHAEAPAGPVFVPTQPPGATPSAGGTTNLARVINQPPSGGLGPVAGPTFVPTLPPTINVQPDGGDTFSRMLGVESGGHQFDASGQPTTSPKGALGIAQVMPGTAPEAARYAGLPFDEDRYRNDPDYNKALGKAYFDHQLQQFGGDPQKAAAAYNAGPGAVMSALGKADKFGGSYLSYLPAETQNYVARVFGADNGVQTAGGSGLGGASAPSMPAGVVQAYDDEHPGSARSAPIQNVFTNAMGGSDSGTKGLFGASMPDNVRLGLLSAGLGMMASPSMSVGQAIGQGGLQGVQAMMQGSKQAAEVGLTRAQTSQVQTEQQIKQQQLNLMLKAMEDTNRTFNNSVPDASHGTPGVPGAQLGNPGAGVVPTAGAPSASAAPLQADPNAGKAIDPLYDPARLRAAAAVNAYVNPAMATNFRDQAAAIESGKAMVRFSDGTYGFMPGYNAAAATQEAQKVSASEGAKSQFDLVEVQPEPGGPTQLVRKSDLLNAQKQNPSLSAVPPGAGTINPLDQAANSNPAIAKQPAFIQKRQEQLAENENEMTEQFKARQLGRQRLQTIAGIMQNYQPGALAEEKASLVAGLRAVGIDVPDTATANPTAFQEFMKNATANVFNDVKSMGGRVLQSEIQGLTKANVYPGMQPAAAAGILGQAIGLLDYEDRHFKDYMAWKDKNPNAYNTSGFEIPWVEGHPVSQFVNEATKGIGYRGQQVPSDPAARTVGQIYQNAQGKRATWSGSGWVPVQ